MKKYEISEDLVKALLTYLETKPFKEVSEGVKALMSLEELKEVSEEKSAN